LKNLATSEHLSKMFDRSLEDLALKTCDSLDSLGTVIHSLGQLTGDPLYYLANTPISSFATHIMRLQQFVAIPVLPKEIRPRYEALFDESLKIGRESIRELKEQLCNSTEPNHAKMITALGNLERQAYQLWMAREAISRMRPPFELGPSTQE